MKKTFSLILAAVLVAISVAGCGTKSGNTTPTPSSAPTDASTPTPTAANLSGGVKTGGSTSVEKVMTALIYQFQADNREVTVDYEMNGSGDGIKNTISGLYELGHSSRELKSDGSEDGLTATAYAIDGIAVVVHKDNSIATLTAAQLRGIYTGEITNWKEVGGSDALITVVTREEGSGTRSAFSELIGFKEAEILTSATVQDSTGAVQTTVSQNPNAIGYISFSDADTSKVNTVPYEGVAVSEAALKDGSYKLKREFYLLTKTGSTLSPAAQAFFDFVLSAEGQKIVSEKGLLPIR
ncbi:MAG: phosphate ABC transporter substrate-binding protein [Oscillospiraceae bacterium]|jgi:phosphate transport system substrate-binding protein|nr:phosphate ABC transporter substrate-binding protein [Oscillospiraceae bacterium]